MNASNDSSLELGRQHIFLIGFMGSGKSYWGKLWAAESGLPFIDLDDLIEAAEKKTIAAIFEEEGESYFRQRETAILKTLSQQSQSIIACGGGVPCFNNNMQWMNDNGITVYLDATPEYIAKRVSGEQEKRPLIKGLSPEALLAFIEKKITEREAFYNQAKIILPVTTITANSINTILYE